MSLDCSYLFSRGQDSCLIHVYLVLCNSLTVYALDLYYGDGVIFYGRVLAGDVSLSMYSKIDLQSSK